MPASGHFIAPQFHAEGQRVRLRIIRCTGPAEARRLAERSLRRTLEEFEVVDGDDR